MYRLVARTGMPIVAIVAITLFGCEQQSASDAPASSTVNQRAPDRSGSGSPGVTPDMGGSNSHLGGARDAAERTIDRLEDRQREIGQEFDDLYK